jgi:hypothetical protein
MTTRPILKTRLAALLVGGFVLALGGSAAQARHQVSTAPKPLPVTTNAWPSGYVWTYRCRRWLGPGRCEP